MDYYLKADTEIALMLALEAVSAVKKYSVKNENGDIVEIRYAPQAGYNLDLIGTIYKPTGNILQQSIDGVINEVPEMEALPGFHANLRGPIDLAPTFEYIPHIRTEDELNDPNFIMPLPTVIKTPSPIEALLVYPQNPVRVWA